MREKAEGQEKYGIYFSEIKHITTEKDVRYCGI